MQPKQTRTDFSHFFAIQNPTNDLAYTNIEVETIRSFFSSNRVLVKQEATKAALDANLDLLSAHCNHFSCHGEFNLASPLESALILANNERLSLGEIFELNLNQCRLVTLSACETGLTDPTSLSDEYIGLPSGFIYAGSPNVVSSLWTVSDLSTAFLMIKFYQNLQTGMSVAVALNQAQFWVRNITGTQLWQWIQETQLPLSPTQKIHFRRIAANIKLFQDPFHWAPFCAIGV
ncbi:CHAT domain-containing protein [Aetokthonos hydrillicola Thurmond2011]|uniref:CHAT domain-containing protein n=1 Tax=Aetokthonos hydrillicola Thurmond2011 TaxID=2712845 RepID=A0AAP5I1I7_9CYAN|nr:CHAT domain-containing protein [Aetokthonos hydrillicola]MBO3460155.1 CHAT domain-containing protein [Aetokthonos hydrillicola CCALA 1050]MBW4590482.1 CHAT domain-containing protein [Aetokthonos hydrillicola CCALA 1050]MDR9893011.1 CHAT domain-containing protein [Aetokthonos hydrillicola Thurmond2011]